MKKQHRQDAINLLMGLWIFFAPWILGYRAGTVATGNFVVLGILITFCAFAGLAEFRLWKEWVNLVLGVWLLISPWALHFSGLTALAWSAVFSGTIVVVCACWALCEGRSGKPLLK
jgi:SPW repeat